MAFKFEKLVIDKILNTIKKHQEYLTKPEHLGQLAKLGYMYNTLWYNGRISWGYNGTLKNKRQKAQCENNPKYKIEMCDPKNAAIDCLIYDAWAMHVDTDTMHPSWEEFSRIVLQGEKISDLDRYMLKPNKTFEDWVEILTDENFKYVNLYPNRRAVANSLLCTIGNEYGYKNGHIVNAGGGADEDLASYGDWKNAKFHEDIQKIVDEIMSMPEVKETINSGYLVSKEWQDKKDAEELKRGMAAFGMPYEEWCKLKKEEEKKNPPPYHPYYPICNYSNIFKFDENTHPSYIKAGIEICEDILAHKKVERPGNVKFANEFLKKFNKGE